MIRHPPISPLFPYTPLSRSDVVGQQLAEHAALADAPRDELRVLPAVVEDDDLVGRRLGRMRSEEHTSELQSRQYLVCRLLLEKKKTNNKCIRLLPRTKPIRP